VYNARGVAMRMCSHDHAYTCLTLWFIRDCGWYDDEVLC